MSSHSFLKSLINNEIRVIQFEFQFIIFKSIYKNYIKAERKKSKFEEY
jgi:hypothetical protein